MDSRKMKQFIPMIVGVVFLVLDILWPVFARSSLLDANEPYEGGIWAVWLCILSGLIGFTALMMLCNQVGHARYGKAFRLSGGLAVVIGGTLASWFYALLVRTNQLIGYAYDELGKTFGKLAAKEYSWFTDRGWRIALLIIALLILAFGVYLVIGAMQGKKDNILTKLGLNKLFKPAGSFTSSFTGAQNAQQASGAGAQPAAGTKFCRNCGAAVAADAAFCNSCGASLRDDA